MCFVVLSNLGAALPMLNMEKDPYGTGTEWIWRKEKDDGENVIH